MPAKDTKITDTKYLEALAKARVRALEVRRAKADEKKLIKSAADFEHQQKLQAAREKLGTAKPPPKAEKKPEKKPKEPEPETEPELESESSVSSVESAPPPQAPPPKQKQPNPHRGSAPMRERPPIPQQQRAQPSREQQIAQLEWRRLQQNLFGY